MRTVPLLLAGWLAFIGPVAAQRFDGANEWLNSPPLALADLRGKVVLVDFGTYTCINWLRTLPYVRAWADKYRGPRAGGGGHTHPRVRVREEP